MPRNHTLCNGGLISDKRIKDFRCKIIVGAANHQLNQDKDAVLLHENGILWIPDFMSNCGGLLNAIQRLAVILNLVN